MAHYISVQKMMSVADFIEVFIRDIIRHHGVPEVLITDWDKLFMSEQWTSFCFHMQCHCNMLTAFHPQTDSQTERQNQFLKAYLHIFVDKQQENWAKLLLCAEFSYNNFIHVATGMTPFSAKSRARPLNEPKQTAYKTFMWADKTLCRHAAPTRLNYDGLKTAMTSQQDVCQLL